MDLLYYFILGLNISMSKALISPLNSNQTEIPKGRYVERLPNLFSLGFKELKGMP